MGRSGGYDWESIRDDGLRNWEYAKQKRDDGLQWDEIGEEMKVSADSVRKAVARFAGNPTEREMMQEFSEEVALKLLRDKGYELHKNADPTLKEIHIDADRFKGTWSRFGIVGDTQLGSRYAQVTLLHEAYEFFRQEGITEVLHLGDLTDGQHMYRGHEFELAIHGADNQVDYTLERYPKIDGITTHIISGNHDLSYMKNEGMDIVKRICQNRDDLNYLGRLGAYLNIGNQRIYLMHPTGGVAYARSYHLQKIIEQFAPENKPHVLLCGHWHINDTLPMYRNVWGAAVGCFQSQTPYLVAKGLYPEVGFGIYELCHNGTGAVRHRYEWIPQYVTKLEDW